MTHRWSLSVDEKLYRTILCRCSYVSLLWGHNGHDVVWNHQPHDCLLNRSFRPKSRKASKIRVTGLLWPVNSPHKGPISQKTFPFDDVIMTHAIKIVAVRLICHWALAITQRIWLLFKRQRVPTFTDTSKYVVVISGKCYMSRYNTIEHKEPIISYEFKDKWWYYNHRVV